RLQLAGQSALLVVFSRPHSWDVETFPISRSAIHHRSLKDKEGEILTVLKLFRHAAHFPLSILLPHRGSRHPLPLQGAQEPPLSDGRQGQTSFCLNSANMTNALVEGCSLGFPQLTGPLALLLPPVPELNEFLLPLKGIGDARGGEMGLSGVSGRVGEADSVAVEGVVWLVVVVVEEEGDGDGGA
ncbi:hypothetical protein HKX48_003208, partial [Thoreauomyces humboldtii]